jgi:hypothetical protein
VPLIIPARVIDYGINANTFYRHTCAKSGANFLGNKAKPERSLITLSSGFSD